MLVFQVELLLKLIDFDLKLNSTFPFKVVCFEQLQLKWVTFLAHSFTFLSQFCFSLLGLKELDLQLADLFLHKSDAFA